MPPALSVMGAVRVHGDDHALCREQDKHGDRSDGDAVQAGQVLGREHGDGNNGFRKRATDCMPTARPEMMFVAGPVSDTLAIDLTGFQREPV